MGDVITEPSSHQVPEPSALARRRGQLEALTDPVDLLVVGGGVNGLAIAWDAALAGLSVVVVDKGDWGSGTSSWSSRMIHGGLKYLEKYDVALVRESLRDREWLLRSAPHLVRPLPFVLPFYAGDHHSKLALRAGMLAYDVLSFDKSVPRHQVFDREETLARLPGLATAGLKGAARYYDAQVEYAERLCVELAIGAGEAGANALNHVRVSRLVREGERVVGAELVDQLTGAAHRVRAEVTINVTGAWADDVLADTPLGRRRWVGGTKGTHVVVDAFPGAPSDAMYFESEDARPMMVIPWLGRYLLGSTDKRFAGDLDTVSADPDELDYILHETNRIFPGAGLTRDSIHYWYTGVRPLPYVSAAKTADISRRHEIVDHAPELEGLLTVLGGKLTTFRALSKHALEAIGRKVPTGRSRLGAQRLPGHPGAATVDAPPDDRRITRVYGSRARAIEDLIAQQPELARIVTDDVTAGELVHTVRHEQAFRLADILARRTMIGLEPGLGRSGARLVAEAVASELAWSAEDVDSEVEAYTGYVRRFLETETDRLVANGPASPLGG